MPCQIKTSSHSSSSASPESRYWFARHSKSIIFLILTLAVVGVYEAFRSPLPFFRQPTFRASLIGVDNGVMPIEQMEVTITRPIENAVIACRDLKMSARPPAADQPKSICLLTGAWTWFKRSSRSTPSWREFKARSDHGSD